MRKEVLKSMKTFMTALYWENSRGYSRFTFSIISRKTGPVSRQL